MLELIWGILNIVILIYFIFICFKSTKLIRENLGLIAACIFVFGLLSFVSINKTPNKEVFELSGDSTNINQKNERIHLKFIDIEDKLSVKTQLDLKYSENNNNIKLLEGQITRSGFISGTNWKTETLFVQKVESKNLFKYHVYGSLEWRILGAKIFTEHKSFDGEVSLKD